MKQPKSVPSYLTSSWVFSVLLLLSVVNPVVTSNVKGSSSTTSTTKTRILPRRTKEQFPIKLTEDPSDDGYTGTDTRTGATTTDSDADASTSDAPKKLIWVEEFSYSGAPDANLWSYDVGGGGWGNNELQVYTSTTDNAVVENGLLKLIARRNGDEFTSARLKTEDKFAYTYGILEARIKVPNLDAGLWAAFWTMGTNFYQVGWPKSGEIDIMEMGQGLAIEEGLVNHRVVSAAHWDIFGQYATYARSYDSSVDLSQDFHVYRMEWTPESMTTYVDGNWIWEIDINESVCPSCQELHQPHHILFNLAVGGGFTSGAASSSSAAGSSCAAGASSSGGCGTRQPADVTAPFPAEMQIDWIRLYDNGHTIINTPLPTPNPTPSPTLSAPRQPDTPPPSEPPLAIPVTQAPQASLTRAPGPYGKGGKGKSSGSRSRIPPIDSSLPPYDTIESGSRSRAGISKSKAKNKSRSGIAGTTSTSGGKGRWSRSGTTATYGKGKGGKSRYSTTTATTGKGGGIRTDGTTDGTVSTGGTGNPATTASTRSPVPPGGGGPNFQPIDNGDSTTSDGGSGTVMMGPQSLVTDPRSGAVNNHSRWSLCLSLILPCLVALGFMTGAVFHFQL